MEFNKCQIWYEIIVTLKTCAKTFAYNFIRGISLVWKYSQINIKGSPK